MSELNIRHLARNITDLSPLAFECGVLFNPIGNFSLARLPNGNWLCSLRRFGYVISTVRQAYLTNPSLRLPDPDGHLLLELDRNFDFVRKFNLTHNEYYKHELFKQETPYLEDGRFIEWNGKYYLTSAIFYQDNQHYQKFGLEVQEVSIDGETAEATHIWNSVEHGILGRHKNWMPIPDRPFNFIIGTSGNGTQTIDIQANKILDVGNYNADDLYRGNTPLVKDNFRKCYWTITHKLTEDAEGRKRYVNYLVAYNEDLSVRSISKPFKLCDSNIEFVTAMFEENGKLFIGCTEMDDTPYMMEFDKEELLNLLSN